MAGNVIYKELLLNLKKISKIQVDEKVAKDGNGNLSVKEVTSTDFYHRYGVTRKDSYNFIKEVAYKAIEYAKIQLDSQYMKIHTYPRKPEPYEIKEYFSISRKLTTLARELENSTKGILNLCETYRKEKGKEDIIPYFEQLIEEIEDEVGQIKQTLSQSRATAFYPSEQTEKEVNEDMGYFEE